MSMMIQSGRFGGSSSPSAHRYWKLSTTAAVNAGNVTAISTLVLAESAGGPQVVGAATVTDSTHESGFPASNAFDGDSATLWVSANTATQPKSIMVDYGSNPADWKAVEEIRIEVITAWLPQGPAAFDFGWSDDGVTYTTTISASGQTYPANADHRSLSFQSASCTDVISGYLFYRVLCTGRNQPSQVAFGEFEFRETVSGADVSTQIAPFFSTESTGNVASNLFDNNSGTGWFSLSGHAGDEYVGCDMLQRRVIAELYMLPYSGFPSYAASDGKLQGSNDYSSWTDVITFSGQTGWTVARTFT